MLPYQSTTTKTCQTLIYTIYMGMNVPIASFTHTFFVSQVFLEQVFQQHVDAMGF